MDGDAELQVDVKSDQYPGAAPPILDNAAPGNNDHTMISDESMFSYRNIGHHKPDTPENHPMTDFEIALKAVQLYAEMHPRPPHVTQAQAAEMLHRSEPTVRKLIRSGIIRLNAAGLIPVSEIDRVLAARAEA